jgi:hypothetical protein
MSLTVFLGLPDRVEKISCIFCRPIIIQQPKRSSNIFLHFLPKFLENRPLVQTFSTEVKMVYLLSPNLPNIYNTYALMVI